MGKNITVIPGRMEGEGRFDIRNPIPALDTGKEKVRVAAYCRVSTEYEEQQHSFQNQVEYYESYVAENPNYELVDIYGDEGKSGTGCKWRKEFNRMLDDCRAGKIDMVITKSISRFARNTQDCLEFSRELKGLGIPVYFEKENICSMGGMGELFFTILSSLAQEESRNISENVRWAYEAQFRKGKVVVDAKRFLGFDKDKEGNLVINEEQAMIVRRIYSEYMSGYSETQIAKRLNANGINGIYGKPSWMGKTIRQVLTNEKNKGDLLLHKTYVKDYLSKTSYENTGQCPKYYVKDDHEAIIDKDMWEATQLEIERRERFRKDHDIKCIRYHDELDPFQGRVVCGECGDIYIRSSKEAMDCRKTVRGGFCVNREIKMEELKRLFNEAWQHIVSKRDTLMKRWERGLESDNALVRYRTKQMIDLSKRRRATFDPYLVLKVLDRVVVERNNSVKILFLDGTEVEL